MTEKETNTNTINFYEEKKWIMAHWFKEVADSSSMPPYIRQLAGRKGYCVKKCSTKRHPLRVSGYAIFKDERDKQPKYGKKFNLTAQQVKEILEAKEDK